MIIEILSLVALLGWIALGVMTFFKLRSLTRRANDVMDTLEMVELIELKGTAPDEPGKKGPWGHCPKCGAVGCCKWDADTDTRTCRACGYTS